MIEKQQVWVGTLACGPDGTTLNSSYQNRSVSESGTDLMAPLSTPAIRTGQSVSESVRDRPDGTTLSSSYQNRSVRHRAHPWNSDR